MPQPEPGLPRADVEEIVREAIASIPPMSAPAEYTRHFVERAIPRYEAQGLDASPATAASRASTASGTSSPSTRTTWSSVTPDPERRSLDLKGWVGTDANSYEFGPEVLSATEESKWVSYVYRNPESGGLGTRDFELKNAWVSGGTGCCSGRAAPSMGLNGRAEPCQFGSVLTNWAKRHRYVINLVGDFTHKLSANPYAVAGCTWNTRQNPTGEQPERRLGEPVNRG